MIRIINIILDLIYPPKCAFCRKIIGSDMKGLCPECYEKLPVLKGSEQITVLGNGALCRSALLYEEMVRDSFLRYKFYGLVSYAEAYSQIIFTCLADIGQDCDILTWIPLGKRRRRKRGYDQAELLARGLAPLLGLDCKRILYKNKDTKAQSLTKDINERKTNIRGAWSVCKDAEINGKKILVIDDVVTTGSTLSECTDLLKKAGAASVKAATLAKAAK